MVAFRCLDISIWEIKVIEIRYCISLDRAIWSLTDIAELGSTLGMGALLLFWGLESLFLDLLLLPEGVKFKSARRDLGLVNRDAILLVEDLCCGLLIILGAHFHGRVLVLSFSVFHIKPIYYRSALYRILNEETNYYSTI